MENAYLKDSKSNGSHLVADIYSEILGIIKTKTEVIFESLKERVKKSKNENLKLEVYTVYFANYIKTIITF